MALQNDQLPGTCAGHPFLMRKIDDLAEDMKDGFERLGQKIEDMRVEQAETNQSLKGAWREINANRDKIDEVPAVVDKKVASLKSKIAAVPKMIADALAGHKGACAIGDITKTEIKFPDREDGHERRSGRGRRYDDGADSESSMPPSRLFKSLPRWAIAVGAGIVLAVVLVGIFIGVAIATGDTNKASRTVRGLATGAASHVINDNDTGESPEAATTATKE